MFVEAMICDGCEYIGLCERLRERYSDLMASGDVSLCEVLQTIYEEY